MLTTQRESSKSPPTTQRTIVIIIIILIQETTPASSSISILIKSISLPLYHYLVAISGGSRTRCCSQLNCKVDLMETFQSSAPCPPSQWPHRCWSCIGKSLGPTPWFSLWSCCHSPPWYGSGAVHGHPSAIVYKENKRRRQNEIRPLIKGLAIPFLSSYPWPLNHGSWPIHIPVTCIACELDIIAQFGDVHWFGLNSDQRRPCHDNVDWSGGSGCAELVVWGASVATCVKILDANEE